MIGKFLLLVRKKIVRQRTGPAVSLGLDTRKKEKLRLYLLHGIVEAFCLRLEELLPTNV